MAAVVVVVVPDADSSRNLKTTQGRQGECEEHALNLRARSRASVVRGCFVQFAQSGSGYVSRFAVCSIDDDRDGCVTLNTH